jgi:hypothetical protein
MSKSTLQLKLFLFLYEFRHASIQRVRPTLFARLGAINFVLLWFSLDKRFIHTEPSELTQDETTLSKSMSMRQYPRLDVEVALATGSSHSSLPVVVRRLRTG